jgi:phenylpropionate dioxygenase-like ring-hydroxylating dioxygenase large terminal subunit
VLSAVCRHRGHVIAEREDDAARLRCPYHYWTYALDGRLLGAPSMSPAHELETLRTSEGLLALRVEIWHGMVFATFDRDLPVLSHWLLGAGAAVSPYRIDEMVVAETVTLSGLEFNWKNMQENALEEYHTTYVHRGYHENAPAHLVRHGPFAPGDGAIYRHAGLLIGGGEPVPGRPTFPVIDRLPEIARHDFLFVAVPPLMFAVVRPDGVKMFRITPEAVDRTTLTISFLFPPTTLAIDGFDRLMDRQRELIELIDRPDLVTNAQVFRGLRSWNAPRGPYSPQETSLPQFNQWLLDRYTAGLNRQEAIS